MIPAIRAELRKLLTTRSTYAIIGIAYALLAFLAFYVESFKNGQTSLKAGFGDSFLAASIPEHSAVLGVFGAIIALLLLTQEYRYGTIVYAITSSNSRTKVLLAKVVTVFLFILVFTLMGDILGLALMLAGAHTAGLMLPDQTFSFGTYFSESLIYCEGYGLAGLLFAALLHNQIGAVATLLLVPSTVEALLRLLLGSKAIYLPFTALSQVVPPPATMDKVTAVINGGTLTPAKGTLVFLGYLVGGWIIAWILFIRRDAM